MAEREQKYTERFVQKTNTVNVEELPKASDKAVLQSGTRVLSLRYAGAPESRGDVCCSQRTEPSGEDVPLYPTAWPLAVLLSPQMDFYPVVRLTFTLRGVFTHVTAKFGHVITVRTAVPSSDLHPSPVIPPRPPTEVKSLCGEKE